MALTPQEKLALMMTSAGTQRKLADFAGLTHQQVGRILRIGDPGGGGLKHQPTDPELLARIDTAFQLHREVCRDQAQADRLPFDPGAPVYAARLWKQAKVKVKDRDGQTRIVTKTDAKGRPVYEPGDRVSVDHTHWLSDALRNRVLGHAQRSGKFMNASVGSLVNLKVYSSKADKRFRIARRTADERAARDELKGRLEAGQQAAWVFTKYAPIPSRAAPDIAQQNIADQLREKHEPATGEPGTKLAGQILLQAYPSNAQTPAPAKGRSQGKGRRTR